jgi:hypothetical protein
VTKRTRVAALLLGLLVAALALAQSGLGNSAAVVTDVSGSVLIQVGNGEPRLVRAGRRIPPGAVVLTGADASAVLTFADGQIVVVGERTTLRIADYRYDPKDMDRNRDTLHLVAGSVRIVIGAIGQHNPRLVHLQVGSGTNFRASLPERGSAAAPGIVIEGSTVLVTVVRGQAFMWLSSGRGVLLDSGSAAFVAPGGDIQQGGMEQLVTRIGQTADGKQILAWLQELQSFEFAQRNQRTVITLAAPHTFDIPDLPPPAAGPTTVTAATGAGSGGVGGGVGGGGLPCPASCN